MGIPPLRLANIVLLPAFFVISQAARAQTAQRRVTGSETTEAGRCRSERDGRGDRARVPSDAAERRHWRGNVPQDLH